MRSLTPTAPSSWGGGAPGSDGQLAREARAHHLGAVPGGVGQHDGELLAAVARGDVDAGADVRAEDAADLSEHEVARRVPEAVVEVLEVVDVDHEQRQRQAVALGAGDLLVEALVEVAVVVEPREAVGDGLPLERAVQRGVGQRRGGLTGEDLQEFQFVVAEDEPLRARGSSSRPSAASPDTNGTTRRWPPDSSASAGASPSTARRRSSSSSTAASSPRGRGRRTSLEGNERLTAPEQQCHGAAGDGEQIGDVAPHLAEHGADVERRDQHAARLAAAPRAAGSGDRRAGTAARGGWRWRPALRGRARAPLRRGRRPARAPTR